MLKSVHVEGGNIKILRPEWWGKILSGKPPGTCPPLFGFRTALPQSFPPARKVQPPEIGADHNPVSIAPEHKGGVQSS